MSPIYSSWETTEIFQSNWWGRRSLTHHRRFHFLICVLKQVFFDLQPVAVHRSEQKLHWAGVQLSSWTKHCVNFLHRQSDQVNGFQMNPNLMKNPKCTLQNIQRRRLHTFSFLSCSSIPLGAWCSVQVWSGYQLRSLCLQPVAMETWDNDGRRTQREEGLCYKKKLLFISM